MRHITPPTATFLILMLLLSVEFSPFLCVALAWVPTHYLLSASILPLAPDQAAAAAAADGAAPTTTTTDKAAPAISLSLLVCCSITYYMMSRCFLTSSPPCPKTVRSSMSAKTQVIKEGRWHKATMKRAVTLLLLLLHLSCRCCYCTATHWQHIEQRLQRWPLAGAAESDFGCFAS